MEGRGEIVGKFTENVDVLPTQLIFIDYININQNFAMDFIRETLSLYLHCIVNIIILNS